MAWDIRYKALTQALTLTTLPQPLLLPPPTPPPNILPNEEYFYCWGTIWTRQSLIDRAGGDNINDWNPECRFQLEPSYKKLIGD
jgi:hypothetical protein